MNKIIITDIAEACVSNDGEYCLIDQCQHFRKINNRLLCVAFKNYAGWIDAIPLIEINGQSVRAERCKQNELKRER